MWNCDTCTLVNQDRRASCAACGSFRPDKLGAAGMSAAKKNKRPAASVKVGSLPNAVPAPSVVPRSTKPRISAHEKLATTTSLPESKAGSSSML
eukprot:6309670-Prymnesium_polylepis.1